MRGPRAGPGCLNSAPRNLSGFLPGYADCGLRDFDAAAGGRSRPELHQNRARGFMPPPRSSGRRSRPHPAFSRQGSNAGAAGYRTRFENAHRIACREVLYRLHPWFGREVSSRRPLIRRRAIFQCSVDGSDAERWPRSPHGCSITAPVRRTYDFQPSLLVWKPQTLSTLLDPGVKTTSGSSKYQLSGASGSLTIRIEERTMARKSTRSDRNRRKQRPLHSRWIVAAG